MNPTFRLPCLLFLGFAMVAPQAGCGLFSSQGPKRGKGAQTMEFRRVGVMDGQGIGREALSFLLPKGWTYEGGVQWILQNPAQPAAIALRIRSGQGREEMEVFPDQSFFWSNNPQLLSLFPVGSRYFGAEVRPLLSCQEALRKLVLGRFRQGVSGVRVVSEKPLPQLAAAVGAGGPPAPGVQTLAEGAMLRVEYLADGIAMEEDVYEVVEGAQMTMPSLYGPITNLNWSLHHVFSFRAEKGRLDDRMRVFQTVAFSMRLDPRWFNTYVQLVEQLLQAQIRQINHIGEISRLISRTHNEISDRNLQAYHQRQAIQDRVATQFSDSLRGVDRYAAPGGTDTVVLPSGYGHAWGNSSGEYILSDDPTFDPNLGSHLHWQPMQLQR